MPLQFIRETALTTKDANINGRIIITSACSTSSLPLQAETEPPRF